MDEAIEALREATKLKIDFRTMLEDMIWLPEDDPKRPELEERFDEIFKAGVSPEHIYTFSNLVGYAVIQTEKLDKQIQMLQLLEKALLFAPEGMGSKHLYYCAQEILRHPHIQGHAETMEYVQSVFDKNKPPPPQESFDHNLSG